MTTENMTDNGGGATKGRGNHLPKRGPWGVGVNTVRVRVPEEIAPNLAHELKHLLLAIRLHRAFAKDTRNWVEFNRLIEILDWECPSLMGYTPQDYE